ICSTSIPSAVNARLAGAHRVELCNELAVGGITPSFGLIKQVLKAVSIPVFVLIRPRSGNFTYSDVEFQVMKSDIEQCKKLGVSGIVSGVLHKNNTIDIKRTQELIALAKPLSFTFHRAFDWVENPLGELQKLMKIGVDRLLTSGQKPTAVEGLDMLLQLKEKAGNKLIILPGGGINAENAGLFRQRGFKEIHASASSVYEET